jgi:tetratricopeptide (TPR) repeat protein
VVALLGLALKSENDPPARARLLALRAGCLARLGGPEEVKALADVEEALKVSPQPEDARLRIGWAFFHLGKVPEALEQWRTLEKLVTDDARQPDTELLVALAVGCTKSGTPDEARAAYARLLAVNPLYGGKGGTEFVGTSARPKREREAIEEARAKSVGAASAR